MSILMILVHLLHGLFATAYIGGMMFMAFVFEPSLRAVEPAHRGPLLGAVAKRFTILAWMSVIVLLVTGFVKTPGDMLFDTQTPYGATLLLKHIVFAVMIGIGLVITFVAGSRLRAHAPRVGEPPSPEFLRAQRLIQILSTVDMILGIIVLVLVGKLKG
jgi:putative copper export protein